GIISSFKIDRKVKNVKAENANADGVEFETVKGVNAESDDMMEGTQNINAGGIKTNKEPNKFSAGISKFFTGVKNVFDKCLNFSISRKWGAVGLAFALFIGSAALLFINGWTLMPATDEGEFTQTISFKSGANFDKEEIPGLAADIYAVIKNSLGDDLDTCLVEYTAGGNMMSMMSGGSGGESMGISITLKDSRKIETEVAAQNVNKALKDVIVLTQNTNKYYYGKLDEEVTYSASTMTSGLVAESITVILTSDEENPVKANEKLGNLQSKMLAALGADKIEGVYSVRSGYSATTITQVDKRVTTTFEIKINDNAKISDVQSRVDAVVAKLLDENDANYDHIFDGIQTANDGFAEQMNETYTSLGLAIVVGLILVYLVMVMVFQSFVMPLIVLICIPLAFTGSFMALAICGMPLSVPSLIGFMILMGIIVNNGILAVDYTNQCRRNRLKVKEALVSAIHTRMRPIFMTALTTIIGLVPMAFNWSIFGESMGGAMMQPLAVVAIGGLLFGTLTTLLVVPAFYAIFIKDKPEELGVEIESDLLNGGDGNDGEIDDEENGEFVRIRGKKVSKAKRQQSQHINENAVLLDNK
ncbi:MAG: efflux RND transporter permease subunit, partial [Christensenellaceae bacterium]|nr:efflux RND transporter permease subunit [Christensenellaceae bacterium]